jgi:signal transduction histidine kinase
MAVWPEWIEVERSYGAYKTELERAVAAPGVETTPEALTDEFEQAVETTLVRVARESETVERNAAKLRRDGQRDIVLATAVCLAVGLFVSVVSFVETRRRIRLLGHAYHRLSQNKEMIESTLEAMRNAVVTFDLEGKVTGINAQALAVFGLDEMGDAIDRPAEEALARQPRILAIVAPIIVEASAEHRYLGRLPGGGGRLFDVYTAPLEIGGELRGFVVSLADVTEAERAATELRRNRALMAIGQMTAQVAHEIKNPLGGVRLSAQVLERMHAGDARSLEIVRRIQSSVDLLSRIVAELNQFARPRELDLAQVRVGELLDDLLQNVGDRVVEKRIEVVRDVDEELVGNFDEGELRKALINFLVNALEASPEGGTLTVAAARDELVDEVTIRIRDEGHGMDEETLRRLFEPFYTTKPTGTGLGMSIAQKIVEQHRGYLSVQSAVGEGTTIAVTLPLTLAPVVESAAKE